uniref:Uncharacterized protein n=1 Tax=Setaria viridis TaxID=4556 RepID=A0A4U6WRP5_SETVI|nr:hypothetical protein SEVIR_1G337900v2 [Setaria viridis]
MSGAAPEQATRPSCRRRPLLTPAMRPARASVDIRSPTPRRSAGSPRAPLASKLLPWRCCQHGGGGGASGAGCPETVTDLLYTGRRGCCSLVTGKATMAVSRARKP